MKGLQFSAGLFLLLSPLFATAAESDISPEQFLADAFDDNAPDASLLWLTGDRGSAAAAILGHKPASLRVRYWRAGNRTVWILDEIGREKPITAGFIVDAGRITEVSVLAFRESRGWEIRHDFFTAQFEGAGLAKERELDRAIDNITGATLSVNAMRRMARLALFLDSEVRDVAP